MSLLGKLNLLMVADLRMTVLQWPADDVEVESPELLQRPAFENMFLCNVQKVTCLRLAVWHLRCFNCFQAYL